MKENKIYLKSRDYIEGWLKGAGWELSCCPFDAKISNELTHYIHNQKPCFTYNIAICKWIGEEISKYIKKCIGDDNMYNLLGKMIHPDWLIMEEIS